MPSPRLDRALWRDLEVLLELAARSSSAVLAVAAARFRDALHKTRADAPATMQLALWEDVVVRQADGSHVFERAPWRGRLGPEVPVRCDHFGSAIVEFTCPGCGAHARIAGTPARGFVCPSCQGSVRYVETVQPSIVPLKTCLQRQDAKWPGKRAAIHEFCASGECEQGCAYRVRAAYSATADWASKSKAKRGSYQFFRKDAGVQRQKRRLYIRSNVDRLQTEEMGEVREDGLDMQDEDVKELLNGGGNS